MRLLQLSCLKRTPEVLRKKVVLEVMLKALPKAAVYYIREEMQDLCDAMDLASKFFKREGWDEFKYDSTKPAAQPGHKGDDKRD